MAVLLNGHMDADRRKLVFIAGVLLSLCDDMIREYPHDSDEFEVGIVTKQIVRAVLEDVNYVTVNPEFEDAHQEMMFNAILEALGQDTAV